MTTIITAHDIAEARLRRLLQDYAETMDAIVEDHGDDLSTVELVAIQDHLQASFRLAQTLGAASDA